MEDRGRAEWHRLERFLEEDRRESGALTLTLRTYLSTGLSSWATAAALDTPLPTIRYHLRKTEWLTRCRVDDPAQVAGLLERLSTREGVPRRE